MMEVALWLVAFVSCGTAIGAICVDYFLPTGKQHIRNPKWPPHAKFHNGQSVVMRMIQGVFALVLLFEPGQLMLRNLILAAVISSSYHLSAFGARTFPGTAWVDPEFEASLPKPFGLYINQLLGLISLAILATAVGLAFGARRGEHPDGYPCSEVTRDLVLGPYGKGETP